MLGRIQMDVRSRHHPAKLPTSLDVAARAGRTGPRGEGPRDGLDVLVQIADLFRFRWDPPILAVLAERPLRFRALLRRLEAHVGDHVDDNALSRSLHRLTRMEYVRAESERIGQRDFPFYSITRAGRDHVATYDAFIALYQGLHASGGDCNGCCLHRSDERGLAASPTDSLYVHNCQ
jgi:DNA-binding HxlR family transcriptional regulator